MRMGALEVNSKNIYKIGDKVKIRVIEANKTLRKINFELIENDEK